MIPRTDYQSIYLYWKQLLRPYYGLDKNLNVSSLARMTKTYPLPDIKECVESVLTPYRIVQLKYRPLNQHEFLSYILSMPEPIVDKVWNKFVKFVGGTTMGKQRKRLMVIAEKEREERMRKEEKAAEDKKK